MEIPETALRGVSNVDLLREGARGGEDQAAKHAPDGHPDELGPSLTPALAVRFRKESDAMSISRRETSREWWDTQRLRHELFISQEVVLELSSPGFNRREDALALIADLPLLEIDEEVAGVAEIFVREHLMPAPVVGDAVHVAACAVHGVQYLLSWNVRHLANPKKTLHLQTICRRLGLVPPQILTADMLWDV